MKKLDLLITEDDAAVARLLAIYLDSEGYAVRVAGSVKAMQDAFSAATPDLMILDMMLPDGDGWGALRWLRARSQIPVMMLTGQGDIEGKAAGLEFGADDYLAKPFDLRELLARLRNLQRRTV